MDKLETTAGAAFYPADNKIMLQVVSGAINLYLAETGPGSGSRHFLFQTEKGGLICPLEDYTDKEGRTVRLLAVPVRDSQLQQAPDVKKRENWLPALHWIDTCCDRGKATQAERDQYHRLLPLSGLEVFNTGLTRRLHLALEGERKLEVEQNRSRYRQETAGLQASVDSLAGVMDKHPNDTGSTSPLQTGDGLLFAACKAAAATQGISLTYPQSLSEGEPSSDPIGEIAAASQVRTRTVLLRQNWYRQSGGPFVGSLVEQTDQESKIVTPVALLQHSPRSYSMYNPKTGFTQRVTASVAASIEPGATMFYRCLPAAPQSLRDVLRFARRGIDKSDWLLIASTSLGTGLLGILALSVAGKIFDSVLPDGNLLLLIQGCLLLALTALTGFAFRLTHAFTLQRISGVLEKDVQSALWDRLISLSANFFQRHTPGELTSRVMNFRNVHSTLESASADILLCLFHGIIYLIFLFTQSIAFALVCLAAFLLVLLIAMTLCFPQATFGRSAQGLSNQISNKLYNWISGFAKIRMAGAQRRVFSLWSTLFSKLRKSIFNRETIANRIKVVRSLLPLAAAIAVYLCLFTLDLDPTIGNLVVLAITFQALLETAISLVDACFRLQSVVPSCRNIAPVFQEIPERGVQKESPGQLSGDIQLKNVTFRYPSSVGAVLRDVSIHIHPGEHVALTGPSGSGKSTLLRLLLGFETPDQGEVYYDGISLHQLNPCAVRSQLGVVLQSTQLSHGTIYDNIAGDNLHLTHDDIMQAAETAGFVPVLESLPMGLNTVVNDSASILSGGQKQQLMIARAIANRPHILIFDEATNALDNLTQKNVTKNIRRLGATVITVTHRLHTLQGYDQVISLQQGRVVSDPSSNEELANQVLPNQLSLDSV